MRVLVLWSGGIESTSLLKHLLKNTDDEVVAHFIYMDNKEGRARYEDAAVDMLYPELKEIRNFEYSESEITVCDGNGLLMDYEIQYPIAIGAMRYHQCERIYRAGCLEDDWDHVWVDGKLKLTNPNPNEPGFSHKRRAKVFGFFGIDGEQVAPWLPFYAHTKAWHWKHLGNLAEYTWSCRRPKDGHECGECHTCLEKAEAIKGSSFIPEIREKLSRRRLF